MSIRPRMARNALVTAASLILAAMAAATLVGTAAADQNLPLGFLTGGHQAHGGLCRGDITPNSLPQGGGNAPGQAKDLAVLDGCHDTIDTGGTYYFDQINIAGPDASLTIKEPATGNKNIIIWTSSIIVENGGTLRAGTSTDPYGDTGGTLTIYIYGKDLSGGKDPAIAANQGQGALCHGKLDITKQIGPCGIPWKAWSDNGNSPTGLDGSPTVGGVTDYFYQYGPSYGDGRCSDGTTIWDPVGQCNNKTNAGNQVGYFGYKVLAVSYGGKLELFGYKGTPLAGKMPRRGFQFSGNGNQSAQAAANSSSSGSSGDTQNGENPLLRFFPFLGHNGGGNGSGGGNGGGGGLGGGNAGLPACAQSDPDKNPLSSACSWMRLAGDLKTGAGELTLSSDVGDKWWRTGEVGDQMVVTTTDYLPGHSELLTIDSVKDGTVTFHTDSGKLLWPHTGTRYSILDKLGPDDASQKAVRKQMVDAGMDSALVDKGVETRAAVALLTRSIRIISGGDKVGETFEDAGKIAANCKTYAVTVPNRDSIKQAVPNCYDFGAQTVFRQGLQQLQIQGVEFKYMGQGGKMGHYPLHFHMARQVPATTFIKDSTINESMTRWIVLHSTQGVLLQRNIGYKSIGHGFMLQDGTEVDNKFFSNLGIFARAAIDNDSNPRKVPGILAAAWAGKNDTGGALNLAPEAFPYRSDYDHPAVFWIANGWNDFQGNMAAGAGACGMSYWLVPAWNSDMAEVPTATNLFPSPSGVQKGDGMHMKWSGYAGVQYRSGNAGMTPFKSFYANYATTAMGSFSDVGDMASCQGVVPPTAPPGKAASPSVLGIPSFAPIPITPASDKDMYYPHVVGGGHQTTVCPLVGGKYDCSQFTGTDASFPSNSQCANGGALVNCAVVLLDHYTSSFHWAQTNFAAIWSRPKWFLMTNSFLSDVQNGGVTSFTSGDYSRGSVIEGDWALARTSIFVGNTQTGNAFSANSGPFANGLTNALVCDGSVASPKQYCLSAAEGISMPLDNFGTNQRLFNIYDGPMYEDSNIFLDITKTPCANCMYAGTPGVRKQVTPSLCYLPNAAIGWKQPNGFFYPPSFHSNNLFFGQPRTKGGVSVGGVDIRHYVIDALFQPNTYLQDTKGAAGLDSAYCKPVNDTGFTTDFFEGFTDIDRQTELNDDDGSLTGLTNDAKTGTISVNPAEFFNAPLQTAECLSNLGISPKNAGITPKLPCPDANGKLPPTPTPTTATTSPYDYVTTVVYPACGVGLSSGLGFCGSALAPDKSFNDDGVHFTSIEGRGGSWSKECSNPACYGVPLYRQFLTGDIAGNTRESATWIAKGCKANKDQAACRWPFVRMGGQSTFNRSSLTANHGTYYLDTSVTLAQQLAENFSNTKPCPQNITKDTPACAPRSVNVFEKGQTYYMFFLFAKTTTRQTYQIYVGPGFTVGTKAANDQASDLHAVRADVTSRPVNKFTDVDWPTAWTVDYSNGILQITIDMKDQTDLELKPKNGLCLPSSFCTSADGEAGDGPCGGNPDMKSDPSVLANPALFGEIDRTCKVWAVRDVDFPHAGPLGFSFKMPNDPDGQSLAHRPFPTLFPTTPEAGKPDWLAQFMRTATSPDGPDGGKAGIGDCYYPTLLSNENPLPANTCAMPKTAEGGIGN